MKREKKTTSSKANQPDEDEDDEESNNMVTKLDISTAYSSIAEIYLTDLWFVQIFLI